MTVLALNASPSVSSKTAALAAAGVEAAGGGRVVHLAELDAEGLLGRRPTLDVQALLEEITNASRLLLVTPIYRATYSGLLKVVFDQLPLDSLVGSASVLAATAGGPTHFLSLDTGLRSLVASLGGWSTPTVVYATSADFEDGQPSNTIRDRLAEALEEATSVAG
jgi:FMN reductase